ncbi:MAG: uroporphyrinogen decarboxylase family protein [bacterium]
MTGRERILMAIDRGQPDVVPIWELAFNEASIVGLAKHFMDESKLPEVKFFGDMDGTELLQLVEAFFAVARELDLDGASAVSTAPTERVDDKHIRDEKGVVHHLSELGMPYPVDGPIKEPGDLKGYKLPAVNDADFFLIDLARSRFPEKAVSFMMQGPFAISWGLRGSIEKLMMDYIENPGLVHDLSRMTTDYCLECVEKIAAKGADFIVIECDVAFKNGPMMSPAQFADYVGQYYKEIVDHAHKKGLKAIKHSDGVLNSLIPAIIDAGFDGIHPIQPQCMDIGETKREFGDRLCIVGNIDCANLLVFGTPDDVRRSVKETIAVAAPGGGYIISSSNTIHPGVKPENYIAMVEAARKYGKYPELANVE